MLGSVLLFVATLTIFHAAYSAYEHLSLLKALERAEGPLPQNIVIETLFSMVVGVIGASLNAPALKEITWPSEMRKRTIDEMDSRLGFARYVNRGNKLFSKNAS